MWRADSLEKTLMLAKIEGRRRRGWQRMSWLDGITDSMDMSLSKLWEKGVTEDELVGWHHWLNGHEFEQTLGDSEGQGNLACCSPWGCKELDTTEQLNNNNNKTMKTTATEYGLHLHYSLNHSVWFFGTSNQRRHNEYILLISGWRALQNREMATQCGGHDCEKEMLTWEPCLSQVAGVSLMDLKQPQEGLCPGLKSIQNKETQIDGSSPSSAH